MKKPSKQSLLLVAALLPCFAGGIAAQDDQDDWTLHAQHIYTAAGDPIDGGTIRIANGKIESVGLGGSGAELEVFAVTPGMIDLAPGIDMGHVSIEQTDEAVFDQTAATGLDLFSHRWDRILKSGVTTVMTSAPNYNVFSGLSFCLKTGGEKTVAARLVKMDVALTAAMGTQPSAGNQPVRGSEPLNFYYRRPTTRMGVEWLFRKSYYDTIAAQKRGETDNAARDEILGKTLRGELPIVVKAMGTQDVRTAIFLKEEFGIQRMILTNAVEAWREPELVRRSGVGVCLPPFRASGRHPDGFANNSYFLPLRAAKDLYDLGVPIALSARDGRQAGSRLANQAGFAMRGGLSFEAALAAVTLQPARMVGIDDTVGSIEAGKDADLVLWSGKPFEPTSQIVGVLLDGQLVVDPRTKRGENE